jgi:hypothetical protein
LMLAAGANAFRLASPLQRFFRDINMVRVHGYIDLTVLVRLMAGSCRGCHRRRPSEVSATQSLSCWVRHLAARRSLSGRLRR